MLIILYYVINKYYIIVINDVVHVQLINSQ